METEVAGFPLENIFICERPLYDNYEPTKINFPNPHPPSSPKVIKLITHLQRLKLLHKNDNDEIINMR